MTEVMVSLDKSTLPGRFDDGGWEPPARRVTQADAERLVLVCDAQVRMTERAYNINLWHLADVLIYCEDHFGEEAYQLFPDTDFVKKTYANIIRIGRAFSGRERRYPPDAVSFWLHGDVATLEPYQADELLESYAAGELNRAELRAEARKLRTDKKAAGFEQEAMDLGVDEWPSCPTCHGAGKVAPERYEGLVREEVRGS